MNTEKKQPSDMPNVRRWIEKYLKENSRLTLEDIAQNFYVDESGRKHYLYLVDGWRKQARKMRQEQQGEKRRTDLDFNRLLKSHNEALRSNTAEKPKPVEFHEEETIFENVYRTIYRMGVPGGWVYTTITLESGMAMCFVPQQPAGAESRGTKK